jgi:hypothetical protein
LALICGFVVLFGLSFFLARRLSRQQGDPREHETTSLF